MTTVQRMFWMHMLIAVAALAFGYARSGSLIAALVFVIIGVLWFTSQQRSAAGLENIFFGIFLLASGLGLWLKMPGWLALVATTATLGAWDLDHFLQRLNAVEQVEFDTGLGREHLRRLGFVEGVGLLAGLLAMSIQVKIPFWWEALLVILAIIGIRIIVWFVRKQIEK